ncbi:MAG TPA: phasin family protein [Stellaceae bacterium]|jgi:phasin family protein|nr:phasin family protein [Stellaceae bacterium]
MARTRAPVAPSDKPKSARSIAPSGESPGREADIHRDGADFGATNLAAMAQANAVLMEGLGAIGATVYAYAWASFSSAASVARSMIDARSFVDVVALNHDFAQTALEGMIANSARVAEIGVRTTSEALKPLSEHVADTISKLNHPTKL